MGDSRPAAPAASAYPYVAFVLTGIVNTMIGPILPWLAERWSLADADAGAYFTVQFATSLAAGAASSLVASRIGPRRTIGLGLGWMALGLAALAAGSRAIALLGIAASGIGLGLVIPTTNIFVARAFRSRASAALSALNLAWGLGAAAWPLVVAVVATEMALLGVAMTLGLAAFAGYFSARVPMDTAGRDGSPPLRIVPMSALAFFGAFFFLYGGSEPAIGGWLTEFARRLDPHGQPTLAASAFWAGLTAGRGVVALAIVERIEARIAMGGVTVALLALVLLLASSSIWMTAAVAAVIGLGFAPLFPVTVAALSRSAAAGWAGPLISLTSVGGATLPWLVGIASTKTGSLHAGLLVPFAGTLLVAGLQAMFWARHRARPAL